MNIVCDRSLLSCSGVYVIKNTVSGKIYVGEHHEIYNLNAFCRKHGLSQSAMHSVTTGKYKQHKGWTCKYLD
ncbi:MAG: hypothetical protein KME60_13610 [Cyanomargarita calcarea GSE-NOS-MK-12-04C]|uniref:GIY-YIG domain-containing protein n=1 Tax=Cyanomargarita calcarea GSE-NOS-MK-12-04C TaxID=2839659 RepID=A0A951UTE3_9CYAN|nr:hypothetical protein [Cyanomargarita calcarea GSE-NOS-MK-12-04C]